MSDRLCPTPPAAETALAPFPGTRCDAVSELRAWAWRPWPGHLALVFTLTGDLGRLRLPPAAVSAPAPGGPSPLAPRPASAAAPRGADLWRHTCLEAFVAREGSPAYLELNLAPDGAWDMLAFARYREGGPLPPDAPAPEITVRRAAGRLGLSVFLDLTKTAPWLGPGPAAGALRVGLSAVIEDAAGALTYWALRHPGERPDFHAPDGFALRLA